MLGQTNSYGPAAHTIPWFKFRSYAKTDTFPTIAGHYYLLGVQVLSGSSENSQPHIQNLEVITQPAQRCRSGASNGIASDGWLFVVRATGSSARMNCRPESESIDAHPDHVSVHYIDLGTTLPTGIGSTVSQASGSYTLSSLVTGHYYAVFVNALHNTSEYFTVFLRTHNVNDLFHTSCNETNGSQSLCSHGILGIIQAGYTTGYYILRNTTANQATYNCLNWLDLGENFIR